MKKKITALALVICLLAVAVVGGTLAYFTDTDNATNVFTVGSIDITQNEYDLDGNDFQNGGILLPMGGDTAWADEQVTFKGATFSVFGSENVLDKVVTVTNNGNSPAYVRTLVALEAGTSANMANSLWYNNIAVTDNGGSAVLVEDNNLYVDIDGTYYIIVVYTYKDAIAAKSESVPSMTGVALYKNTTQEDVAVFGDEYDVLVLSQAVQADDMGDDAGAALDKAFGDVDAANAKTWFETAF
ncbi:MAG: hypothetical protein IJB09_08030 [Oscillospiraceae bacterium]|nr:hypothetical protein [Oscillospiraceae bacterium]